MPIYLAECARVTIKTECMQMKHEYVTGIYETGVSSTAHPWLCFDCLEGEHKLKRNRLVTLIMEIRFFGKHVLHQTTKGFARALLWV